MSHNRLDVINDKIHNNLEGKNHEKMFVVIHTGFNVLVNGKRHLL